MVKMMFYTHRLQMNKKKDCDKELKQLHKRAHCLYVCCLFSLLDEPESVW